VHGLDSLLKVDEMQAAAWHAPQGSAGTLSLHAGSISKVPRSQQVSREQTKQSEASAHEPHAIALTSEQLLFTIPQRGRMLGLWGCLRGLAEAGGMWGLCRSLLLTFVNGSAIQHELFRVREQLCSIVQPQLTVPLLLQSCCLRAVSQWLWGSWTSG
jgi:hypothetical protein